MNQRHETDIPPVEPLSDTTWRRIERDLFAELDRAPVAATRAADAAGAETSETGTRWWRRPFIGAGLGAALAAAVVMLWFGLSRDGHGPHPSRIVTDAAPVAITVGRAAVQVGPESALWVHHRSDGELLLMLETGQVECGVTHDPKRPPMIVQAGDVRVEVVGTKFVVQRQGGSAQVMVREGVVEVFHDGVRTLVHAGERWPDAVAEVAPEPAANAAAELPPGAADERAADDTSGDDHGAEGDEPTSERELSDGRADSVQRPARDRSGAAGADVTDRADGLDPKRAYEQAAGLEARDPSRALAIYRRLARGDSAWAATALFALARLELERGQERAARRHLERYLDRFPRGANAIDARRLLGSQ